MNKGETPQLKIKSKPKFNKHKCYDCKYHCEHSAGYPIKKKIRDKIVTVHIGCDYISMTRQSCITKDENENKIDLRGDDYNNCKLFKAGRVKGLDKMRKIKCT